MMFRSRSCVIGRGVATFSICSAMALASKIPTQIGRTRSPSLSLRITIGMLVTGSTISPLMVISISMALPSSLARLIPRRRPTNYGDRRAGSEPRISAVRSILEADPALRRSHNSRRYCRWCDPRSPCRAAGSPSRSARRQSIPTACSCSLV